MRRLGAEAGLFHLHRDVWLSIGGTDPFDDATQGVILEIMRIAVSVLTILTVAIVVGACTPARYVKAGADEAQLAADLADCQQIARSQAFRDQSFFESRNESFGFDDFGHRRVIIRPA